MSRRAAPKTYNEARSAKLVMIGRRAAPNMNKEARSAKAAK